MAVDDRLSALPDQLLRRILHFAPAKEAASTRALSRRWRSPLLRSSGAVNLETHVERIERLYQSWGEERKSLEATFFFRRDAFVSAAQAALAAADHITTLTLRVKFEFGVDRRFLQYNSDGLCSSPDQDQSVIATLLSHPAAQHIQVLRLAVEGCNDTYYEPEKEIARKVVGEYMLSLRFLPSETLRVLELTNCNSILPLATTVVFTRLSSMRLRHCTVRLDDLQSLIHAAPALATIHLESIVITIRPTNDASAATHRALDDTSPPPPTEIVLQCSAAIVLMLRRCSWRGNDHETPAVVAVEIHAPRLRRFVYMGLLRRFTMSPQPQDLSRADLHFFGPCDKKRYVYPHRKHPSEEDPNPNLVTFWRFLQDISSTKQLKLRVNNLEDMAVLSEAMRVELLPAFCNLERLELQGVHRPKGKTASVAIANLLRCSPVLRNLRINLTTAQHGAILRYDRIEGYVETKFLSDRDKSVDLINRAEPTTVSLEDDGDVNSAEVLDIPGLSRHSFECLQSSLKRMSLQFRLEESNCLGVKLIKFFTKNATVLEEMHIDTGNRKLCEHMNSKVKTWITSSSKMRKSGASSFMVLPLESRELCVERGF
ncbi:unnamed protein product [Triticum turgidum subsp. durum]|uniref:F-box domain-containing protein n=1 Tax=Triticum turgidum subsp. durum TaxID=4567 RepID=A0A9R1S977_TRITD|nr:unnamed protein product [Triticum turgidum subsp. durum]